MRQDPRNEQQAAPGRVAFNRRRFLRGLGTCLALPAFESLLPTRLIAAPDGAARLATTATGAPLRTAFLYVPNGVIQPTWWPKGEGEAFEFARTMEPLEALKSKVQVLGGLGQVNATPGKDGAGGHARGNGVFLTSVRIRKTAGADIQAGVSIDQMIAGQVGHVTRFRSLELSCDAVRNSGNCDSGYSCAYQYNMAWSSPTTPLSPEPNPRLAFERLFGAGSPGERRENLKFRQTQQKSILDFVLDDAQALQRELASRDRRKLDEFLSGVREIEARIQRVERQHGETPDPAVAAPPGIPVSYEEHVQLMLDLLHLAFQTDSTRVATLLLAHDGSNRPFPDIGVAEGHHDLSHHMNQQPNIDKLADIDRWYVRRLASFLTKLDETKDLDGNSLLDNSMIVYGCGISDGNAHTHVNLPVLLAGAGGGSLNPGRYVKHRSTPLSNLFVSLADRMGVPNAERFGDSTGRLAGV